MKRKREMTTETRAYLAELRREKRGTSARQQLVREVNAARAAAHAWNDAHPIGTEVNQRLDDGTIRVTRTRSVAWALSSGDAVVQVEGQSGGYLLSRIEAR